MRLEQPKVPLDAPMVDAHDGRELLRRQPARAADGERAVQGEDDLGAAHWDTRGSRAGYNPHAEAVLQADAQELPRSFNP
jgi:hypothetical protein